ncbi:MAG: xanthine dehydrogenase family protein molybdopterin-binding subunit [Caldisericia bacterium]|nr:xanthine dehydrogenase family protein molybdopterin-binding subunit [Caldisericia bacterium]
MSEYDFVGKEISRVDAKLKVSGKAIYTNDLNFPDLLHARILTSPLAHAKIKSIDTTEAKKVYGVRSVITGKDYPILFGIYLGDKPPLAIDKVRYFGEPVAAVVADSEEIAERAIKLIKVEYEPLPVVGNPLDALKENAPIIHEEMEKYSHISSIHPEPGTNIANRTKIRKGDIIKGFQESDVIIEDEFCFPPGDHVAMEPRAVICEILPDGMVIIYSSTQAPFVVRNLLSKFFGIPHEKIRVIAPKVGGGFGGKAGIQLEGLALILSKSVNGKKVKLVNKREEDLISSPGRIGFYGKVKIGAKSDGKIQAMDILYVFDSGAYADYAVNISRGAAVSCTGPYNVPNVRCDSLCVYTNHPFATAYRGFGHIELSFAIERAIDILSKKLNMDPAQLRYINAIKKGDTTPTQQLMDDSTGDLRKCIERVKELIKWDEGQYIKIDENRVRAKGISCFWKPPMIPPNTDAGAIITFNENGSINVSVGVVEIGSGTQTGIAQIVASKFKLDISKVNVVSEVVTDRSPHDWTTAASRSLVMAGRAVIEACDDAINQIKEVASQVLRCPKEDLDIKDGKVYVLGAEHKFLELKDIVLGYVYPNGNSIGGPIIGRGKYIARFLTDIDKDTGKGEPSLEYTIGAEAVEVEVNLRDGSYKVLKAACVLDAGKVINKKLAKNQVIGGIEMSIGFTTTEGFVFDSRERVLNYSLRDFKIPRYGEHPEYLVDFIETPQLDGPYGARGIGEEGILGIPPALANAISKAIGKEIKRLPITFERVFNKIREEK